MNPFVARLLPVFAACAVSVAQAEAPVPAPSRVLLVGDSMMVLTANSLGAMLDREGGIEHRTQTSLGSGLARLDVFDWMEKMNERVASFPPELTVAWFGANDNQPMRADRRTHPPGTEAWTAEYARRIGQAMDILTSPPGARVVWLELPDMQDPREQEHGIRVNEIARAEAETRPHVEFFETRPFLSRRPGTYRAHVIGPDGMPLRIRASDGGHLNAAGAHRTAHILLSHILEGNPTP